MMAKMKRRQTKLTTGIVSMVTTRPRRIRRSVSGQSLDIQGKIVVRKSWVFEGSCENYDSQSTEHLSETDTGKDDWCKKHTWYLNTNLMSSQLCAKCNKRILTRRAAYKCTACKSLCHLKCAVQSKDDYLFIEDRPSERGDNMDFEKFVVDKENYEDHRDGATIPYSRVDQNMNITDVKQPFIDDDIVEEEIDTTVHMDESIYKETRGKTKTSTAKHKVNNMRHSFLKKCRSFKKKVVEIKDKSGHFIEKKMIGHDAIDSNVGPTMELCEDTMEEATHAAWLNSPVRTRAQQRQLQLQQQQQQQTQLKLQQQQTQLKQRQQQQQQENLAQLQQPKQHSHSGRTNSIRKNLYQYKKPAHPRRRVSIETELDTIKERLDIVEHKIDGLEGPVANVLAQWKALGKKFRDDSWEEDKTDGLDQPMHHGPVRDTASHDLQTEAVPNSLSSGTTSDEVYMVGRDVSSSSLDEGHMIQSRDHVTQAGHVMDNVMRSDNEERLHSLGFSSQEDSLLPSGIPKRLRMDIPSDMSGVFTDQHTTSTPVTNREISFRSASRQYEQTQRIVHTNVTKVNIDTSYKDPVHTETPSRKTFDQKTPKRSPRKSDRSPRNDSLLSNKRCNSAKVLSSHQEAVRTFLEKRRSSNSFRLSPREVRSPSPTECVERCLTNRSAALHMSPGFVQSPRLAASPPMANSTFRNGQNTTMSSPASFTFRDDVVDSSQLSFEKVEANNSKTDEQRITSTNQQESSTSNLSYTFRNDSQMIRSYGEEDLPGFSKNHSYNQSHNSRPFVITPEKESISQKLNTKKAQMVVVADIEMDAPREMAPLAEARPSSPMSILNDGYSLTNVTELTGDFAISFADSAAESHSKSRWINKDVHLFRRDNAATKSDSSLSMGKIDETGDGRKPPIPGKRRQRSSSDFDFLKEAERSLEQFRNRRSLEVKNNDQSHLTLTRLPRPTALETDSATDDGSEVKEVMVEAFSPQRTEAMVVANVERVVEHIMSAQNSPKKMEDKNFDSPLTKDLCEEIDRQVNQSTELHKKYGHLMSNEERLESQIIFPKPVVGVDQSKSCGSSIKSDARSNKSDIAKYHFLNDKGMVKISSPGMRILSDSPAKKKHREERCSDINEESSLDLVESGSEMSGFVVDNYFRTSTVMSRAKYGSDRSSDSYKNYQRKQANDQLSETTATVSQQAIHHEDFMETLRKQADLENDILVECLQTVDQPNAMSNVLQWMNRDCMDPSETAELEEELKNLVRESREREEIDKKEQEGINFNRGDTDMSVTDGSVYYSFRGQSGELQQLLSPGLQAKSNGFEDDAMSEGRFIGLMDTIMNGSVDDVARLLDSDRTICESEIKDGLLWALENKNLPITKLLLNDIQKLLVAAERDKVVDVYPAYRESNRWRPIFVVLSEKEVAGEWDLFMGLSVYRRHYNFVSREVKMLIENEAVVSSPLSDRDLTILRQAICEKDLHRYHSRITAILPSPCRSTKGGKELLQEACIAIHCQVKGFIPFFEEPFSGKIKNIPVDVREAWFGDLNEGSCTDRPDNFAESEHNFVESEHQIYHNTVTHSICSSETRSVDSQCLSGSNSDLSDKTKSNYELEVQDLDLKAHGASVRGQHTLQNELCVKGENPLYNDFHGKAHNCQFKSHNDLRGKSHTSHNDLHGKSHTSPNDLHGKSHTSHSDLHRKGIMSHKNLQGKGQANNESIAGEHGETEEIKGEVTKNDMPDLDDGIAGEVSVLAKVVFVVVLIVINLFAYWTN